MALMYIGAGTIILLFFNLIFWIKEKAVPNEYTSYGKKQNKRFYKGSYHPAYTYSLPYYIIPFYARILVLDKSVL